MTQSNSPSVRSAFIGSFIRGNENFPILYEDKSILVYTNLSGEIFIENLLEPTVSIRVRTKDRYLIVTSSFANLLPTEVNGLQGIKVSPRGK